MIEDKEQYLHVCHPQWVSYKKALKIRRLHKIDFTIKRPHQPTW
jgi:hypothetical protein